MDINLELYKVFYHVGRCGSISRAASTLFISQPAVSQAIKQLETGLGGALFIRTPKGLSFTPEGEQLFKEIEQGYDMIRSAEMRFLEAIDLDSGEIRIGASDMTLKYYLLPRLENFHGLYPNVRIKVTNGPSPETVKALRAGNIDLGVVSLPLDDKAGLNIKNVYEIRDCFIAGNKYSELKNRLVSLKELCHYPLIMLERNTSTRKYVDQFLLKSGINLIPAFELATSDLLVEFTKRNMGISCVVSDFAKEAISKNSIFQLDLETKIPPRQFGIITLGNSPISAAGKRFLELLDA